MLPACRTEGEGFSVPTFDVVPGDVEGFMDELWEFQSAFHDCFTRSEPRAQFFDYMVGQLSHLERQSIEPMALHIAGGTVRGLQRFISDVRWDEEQMLMKCANTLAGTTICSRRCWPIAFCGGSSCAWGKKAPALTVASYGP